MTKRYRLRTLGGVSLEGADGPLGGAATQHRRLALLAMIAAAGERGVSRERLMGVLWPESEPAKARQVLTQWLHLIRRDLAEDELLLGTQELRLNPERLTSDVGDLGKAIDELDMERAAQLYAGPFLDGFHLSGAPEFERWVDGERDRIAARMRAAYRALATDAAERQEWRRAVRWTERLAILDPLDAGAALAHVRALGNAGERAKAIQHARVYAALVRVELEAEPDPAVAELADSFAAAPAEAAVDVARAVGARPAPALLDAGPPGASSPPAPAKRRPVWLGYVAGMAAVVVFALLAAPASRPKLPTRVMVAPFTNETADSSLGPIGRVAADWIMRGVGETGLVEVASDGGDPGASGRSDLDRASAAGAGTLITGRYYPQGDSLAFTATVVDVRNAKVLRTLGPLVAPRAAPLEAVERLRRRVMGSVASLVDAGFSPLAEVTAEPPSFEAYRAVVDANRAATLRRHREALEHFRRAAALDTSYLFPIVRMANMYGNMFDCDHVDSIGRVLAPRRSRLSPYENYALDRDLQYCAGDLNEAYRSAKRLYALAPRSRATAQYVARSASGLNRPHEALEILLASAADSASNPLSLYAMGLWAFALHSTGEYDRELAAARHARRDYPDQVEPLVSEARALAALGQLEQLREVVATSLTMGSSRAPLSEAWSALDVLNTTMDELRAHGHTAESREVATQFVDWLVRHRPAADTGRLHYEHLHALSAALIGAGRWAEAAAIGDSMAARYGGQLPTLVVRARLAAYRGDVRTAERLADSLARFPATHLRGRHTSARAQIAALLGRREQAVQLLLDAFSEGVEYNTHRPLHVMTFNHAIPEFQSLRGYPPFEALLRPRG